MERVSDLARALFNSETELRHTQTALQDLRGEVRAPEATAGELRDRVAKLEAYRAADHARLEAELSRFKLEVERLLLASTARPTGAEQPGLPPPSDRGTD